MRKNKEIKTELDNCQTGQGVEKLIAEMLLDIRTMMIQERMKGKENQ